MTRLFFGVSVSLGSLFGCAAGGSGRVMLAALNFQAIDPPEGPPPTFTQLDVDECYWWTDESERVWIALRHQGPRLLIEPDWRLDFRMSLRLEGLPAGRARNYVVARRELRATARLGPTQSRFISLSGVVALYREGGDRLRGSYRLEAAREVQQVFGWSRPMRYLLMGTFTAVRDPARGRPIAEASEAPGREREPQVAGPETAPAGADEGGS